MRAIRARRAAEKATPTVIVSSSFIMVLILFRGNDARPDALSYIVGPVEGERRQRYGATNHTHAHHTADSLADNLGFNAIPKLNQRKRPGVRGQIRVADAGFAAFPRAAATGTRLGWLRAMRRGGVSSSSEADRLPLRCIICLRIPEGSCQGTGVGSTARAP